MSDTPIVEDGKEEEIPFATLADLCEPLKPKVAIMPTAVGDRKVKYWPGLSPDKLESIKARHRPRGKKRVDEVAFTLDILRAVMINPKIKTATELRALRKSASCGAFLINIVNEVVDTEFFEEIKEGLGE